MQLYRARNPRKSPLWQCAHRHFAEFVAIYPHDYQPRLGPLRPVIPQVVQKFLDCGNLDRGFARVRCIPRRRDLQRGRDKPLDTGRPGHTITSHEAAASMAFPEAAATRRCETAFVCVNSEDPFTLLNCQRKTQCASFPGVRS